MSRALSVQFAKELRELLPWWIGFASTMLACAVASRAGGDLRMLFSMACLVYAIGAVGLGAISIGHEYTHRTLAALLAQPIDRRRLLATKLAALIPLLVLFAAIAAATLGTSDRFPVARSVASPFWAWLLVPPLCGLFLSPWLTMAARGPLPGIVFSIAIPGLLLMLGRIAVHLWHPWAALVTEYPWSLLWPSLPAFCVIGAVLTWRRFMQLQATEGGHTEIDVAAWLGRKTVGVATATRSRNHIWLLMLKELRLQQMTFALSGLFVAGWIAIVAAERLIQFRVGPDLAALTMLHAGFVSVIAGALASAEERHLAMADWHLLLPMAAWKQWSIKTSVVVASTVTLTMGVPALLSLLFSVHQDWDMEAVPAVVGLSIAALYVSSLNTTGLRALMVAFPVIAAGVFIGGSFLRSIWWLSARSLQPIAEQITPFAFTARDYPRVLLSWLEFLSTALLVVGLYWLLLRFGSANHRSGNRSFTRIWPQVAWCLGFAIGITLIASFANQVVWAGFQKQ